MAAALCMAGTAGVSAQSAGGDNTVFYESFDKINDKGGNDGHTDNYLGEDGVTQIDIASFDIDETNYADYLDNGTMAGWVFEKVAACDRCVRLGTKKNSGSITTPAAGLAGSGTLTFNAFAQSGDKVTVYVEIINGGELTYNGETAGKIAIPLPETTEPAEKPLAECGYAVGISNAAAASQIVFSCVSSKDDKQRFFLDEIRVAEGAPAGISSIKAGEGRAEGIYTISGQRVNASTTAGLVKGLYIVDGRKVVIR